MKSKEALQETDIYPGQYNPLPEVKALLDTLPQTSLIKVKLPLNLNEEVDCFIADLALPGVKREDILVYVHNQTLTVLVLHKNCLHENDPGIHEFDARLLGRDIRLPGNIDLQFISAGYRQGKLHIHLPKMAGFTRNGTRQVVVY